MGAKIKVLLRYELARPFVVAHLETGDYTPLLAMCDCIDEQSDSTYQALARSIRSALLFGRYE